MKHRIQNKSLSRTSSHRKSLMKNLGLCLFRYGYICTTKAKSKHFKKYIGKFITLLLKQTSRYNAFRCASMRINNNKTMVQYVMRFYDKFKDLERKTNYISIKKVSLEPKNTLISIIL